MEIISKIAKQTGWQILGKIITAFSTLLVLGLITRNYGEEGTGVFTLALAYLAFFNLAADLGLNAYILPRLKNYPKEANELFNFRLIWASILIILANIVVYFLPFKSPAFTLSVFWGSFSILGSAIFNSTNLIFQSKLRYDKSVFASSLESLSHIPLAFIFVFLKMPISIFTGAFSLGAIINNIASLILVKNLYSFKIKLPDFKYILATLRFAWPISLTLVLNSIYFRVDTFILSSFHPLSIVGNYNVAYQLFQNALVLPAFMMNSFYPLMLKTFEADKLRFFREIRIAGAILLLISLIGILAAFSLADFAIAILTGSEFSEASISFKILSLGFPAYFLSSLIMWVYLSLKRYKSLALVYTLGLITNLILNFIFIPKYSYIAASAITGISEYLILLLLVVILFLNFRKKSGINN